MILQKKLVDRPYQLPTAGKTKPTQSLTIPGGAFNIKVAMDQYRRGTLVERTQGYYAKQGMDSPDFSTMDRIQQLEALAHYRQIVKEKKLKLDNHEAILEKAAKAKREATGKRGGDTAEPPKPN